MAQSRRVVDPGVILGMLDFRRLPVLSSGQRHPDWVQRLHRRNGVYVIRCFLSGEVLYIGESLSGRLKKTMLRHFQRWEGKGSGPSYDREVTEVACLVLCQDDARRVERSLVRTLQPRDNELDGGRCICVGKGGGRRG